MCVLDYTPYKLLDWIPEGKLDPENLSYNTPFQFSFWTL